jgi:hypothetical protein
VTRKRRRNLAVLALQPTTKSDREEPVRQTNDKQTESSNVSDENFDDELTDEKTIRAQEETYNDMAVKVNLETQKDGLFFAGIINFLRTGQLH